MTDLYRFNNGLLYRYDENHNAYILVLVTTRRTKKSAVKQFEQNELAEMDAEYYQ